ncbi:hypothetical protein LTR62_004445 [Meristemomyces frigidus]|uniref:Protein ZIP4 homolog n=1 Tax=Meristemomyces frigidus TaxID=1508187 RepID=A0AAN7THM1_9PEZI|nr:hypothetical protein LTR62_004445 [Meristemomyces frigidus]
MADSGDRVYAILHERAAIPADLQAELGNIIRRSLPLSSSAPTKTQRSSLDRLGTKLWNAATDLLRRQESGLGTRQQSRRNTRLVGVIRVFGYLLIDAAHHVSTKPSNDKDALIRTFKIALKAGRFCLDIGELDLAMKVLERCSEYAETPQTRAPIVQLTDPTYEDHSERARMLGLLVTEYHLLRMVHAWKTDRSDLAEHFYAKVNTSELAASGDLSEKAADLLHEAARSCLAGKSWIASLKWCERALAALNSCDLEALSQDEPELRLSISATAVEAHLAIGDPSACSHALQIVDNMMDAHTLGPRIAAMLLKLQVLTAASDVDLHEVEKVVRQIISSAVLTDKTFKTIMQVVHRLKRISVRSSLASMWDLIDRRLLSACQEHEGSDETALSRLETAVVTFTMFSTTADTQSSSQDTIAGITDLLDMIHKAHGRSLSSKAAHATQTLIWKRAGAEEETATDAWFVLLRHPLFDSVGQLNKGRIGRKALSAALGRKDVFAARAAYYAMPDATKNESSSRYLAYRLALLDEDQDLALESLAWITRHAAKDSSYLYACVLEAQDTNMRRIAVAALQALITQQLPGVHLPTLLRCTARFLICELDVEENDIDKTSAEVVPLFERAAKNTALLRQGTDAQWRAEIQWWSKTAYNLALRLCNDVGLEWLMRLLSACTHFLDCYEDEDGPMHQDTTRQRRLICYFLLANTDIVLARSNADNADICRHWYIQARVHIEAFAHHYGVWRKTTMVPDHAPPAQQELFDKMSARAFEMLKFDLECILRLEIWSALDPAVKKLLEFNGSARWDSLADLMLIIHQHASTTANTSNDDQDTLSTALIRELLQKSINETWKRSKSMPQMARWLRLTFSIHLEDGDEEFALKIVQQTATVARSGYEGKTTEPYPEDELAWLAGSAFNKAIDILVSERVEKAQEWIEGALEVARYASDNGALHASLTEKKEMARERLANR